ncbi:DNA primase [Maricurvus nonylphenolicus]|uniref:DNA primase n=1 Tax=Maricurvus nonylphenolicus TaxID=1008307 RepID=UPI0036F20ACF
MAGLIPQPFIDDLLDRVDIVDVVDSRVKLKKTGKNYSACCPFHDEKTPSFTVSPDKQFYYCFGCGASGNALGFVLDYDRVSFPEAVEQLARLAGVEVPREAKPKDDPAERTRKRLYGLLEKADEYYQQQLRQHPAKHFPVNYLKNRGLSGAIAKDFGIGFAPPGWDNLMQTLGDSDETRKLLTEAGMLIEKPEDGRRYDRFRNRIMFPIRDIRGRIIGFGGRVLGDDKPKYLNSPETPVFHKGKELYGLYEARQAYRQLPRLLIVEGYMDVVALAQFEIRYACATLGTACGEDHLTRAFRYTSEIVFCFDGDEAGRKAAQRALENCLPTMEDGRHVKFLFLPDGEDPDTLVRQVGAEKFETMIEKAVPLEEFLFDAVSQDINIQTMDGRATLSKRVAPLLHRLPTGVFKELMFANLATRTGLPVDTLMELVHIEEPAPQPAPTPSEPVTSEQHPTSYAPAYTPSHIPAQAAAHHSEQVPTYDEPPMELEATYQVTHNRAPKNKAPQFYRQTQEKHLIALLLQHPILANQVEDITPLQNSDNPDLAILAELIELLQQRPNYSINRILGYWRGTRGADATDELSALAATDLVVDAKQSSGFDASGEFRECLQRVISQLQRQNGGNTLEKLQRKGLNNLSEDEKRLYREELAKARTSK